jgi:hypothetical protein
MHRTETIFFGRWSEIAASQLVLAAWSAGMAGAGQKSSLENSK